MLINEFYFDIKFNFFGYLYAVEKRRNMRSSNDEMLSTHPTVLIRRATLKLLRCLIISTGIHADDVPVNALKTVSGLLLAILDKGSSG